MLKPKYLLPFLIIAILFVGFIIGSPLIVNKIFAQASLTGPLSGYAWSSNIGWIKFHSDPGDPVAFGVQLVPDGSGGTKLSGQAWSSNIGWINFDNLGTGPDGQGSASVSNLGLPTSPIKGWARACSVFASGCTGALKNDIYRGGWDGWLQMGPKTTTNGWPGVSIENNHQLTGYAWGSEVLGWVKFDGLFNGTCTGVCVGTGLSVQCTISNAVPKVGDTVQLVATALNGRSPYLYNLSLSGPQNWASEPGEYSSMSGPASTDWTFTLPGQYIFSTNIKDSNNNTAECSLPVTVTDDNKPNLTVNVIGSGSVSSSPAGISSCKTSCQSSFDTNSTLTLTARPSTNGKFKTWSGDCSATTPVDPVTGISTCTVNMGNSNKTVTANFEEVQKFNLTITYPGGNTMLVNSRSPLPAGTISLDDPRGYISSEAIVTLTRYDNDVPLPDTVNLSLKLDALRSRIPQGVESVVGMGGPTLVGPGGSTQRQYKIYITFTNDAQPKPNTASPYAGSYRLTLTAAPTDGSKTLTAPVNFSYIDSREQEQ